MSSVVFSSLLLLTSLFLIKGQVLRFGDPFTENIKDPEAVREDWRKLENAFKNIVNVGMKMMMPGLIEIIQSGNISSACVGNGMQVLSGIWKLETWAMRFPDSTAKIVDGAITGTIFNYGAYEECLDTVAINERSGKHKGEVMFTGKYCLVMIRFSLPPKKPFYKTDEVIDELKGIRNGTLFWEIAKNVPYLYVVPVRLGLCVPSGCSVNDINFVLANVAHQLGLHMTVNKCDVREETKFTPVMVSVMSLYSLAGFIVLLATGLDIYFYYSDRRVHNRATQILLAFSFISNCRKFSDTSTSSKSLSCLNGIRFLTLSWVIMGHSYIVCVIMLFGNLEYARSMTKDFAAQVIFNGIFTVDTFFFLGGFLLCYLLTIQVVIRKRNFSIPMYIFHRLWRILPTYAFVVLYAFIMEITYSGPAAHYGNLMFSAGCKQHWWTNLLFINNFYDHDDMCFVHTWYLAADVQLYLASLIILLPLFRWPRLGLGISVVTVVCSMAASAIVAYVKNFPPAIISTNPNLDQMVAFGTELHIKPYTHAGPYAIGIITGYILALNPKRKIPKVIQIMGWLCALIFAMSSVYGTYGWNMGKELVPWETSLYAGCYRVAWALSVAWMVLCCATGHGGLVNHILSWKVWILLGRLTFTAYLVHPLVQFSLAVTIQGPIPPLHANVVWLNFGHLVGTYGVAFAVSMLIESPFLSLEKLIIPQNKEELPEKSGNEVNPALDTKEIANGIGTDISNPNERCFKNTCCNLEVLKTQELLHTFHTKL